MTNTTDGERLPGYIKKSFILPCNGGEIWFEHLDGIYDYEELVLKKLANDMPKFSRPASSSLVCFVFSETIVADRIINALKQSILEGGKRYMNIAFVGLDAKSVRRVKKELSGKGFGVGFMKGSEDAKEWLIPKRQEV